MNKLKSKHLLLISTIFVLLIIVSVFIYNSHIEKQDLVETTKLETQKRVGIKGATFDEIKVESIHIIPSETEFVAVTETVVESTAYYDDTSTKTTKHEMQTISYDEEHLLACVIYLEAGNCSEECQWLVGSTAMNLADSNGGLTAVAYNYNVFNVAYLIDTCVPSELSKQVARRVLSGDRDYKAKAFRTDYYHSFGTPYMNVDNVYFSTY